MKLSAVEAEVKVTAGEAKAQVRQEAGLPPTQKRAFKKSPPPTTEEPPAERAQREADQAPEAEYLGSMGANILKPKTPIVDDDIPDAIKADDPEYEDRLAEAEKGLPKKSTLDTIMEFLGYMTKTTRAHLFLPNTAEYAVANEELRLLKADPASIRDEVIRTITAILSPLGINRKKLFQRYLVVLDQLAAMERGEIG